MGWDGNGTLRWKMGWEMAGLTDVLENGMENRKNKMGKHCLAAFFVTLPDFRGFGFRAKI